MWYLKIFYLKIIKLIRDQVKEEKFNTKSLFSATQFDEIVNDDADYGEIFKEGFLINN